MGAEVVDLLVGGWVGGASCRKRRKAQHIHLFIDRFTPQQFIDPPTHPPTHPHMPT